MLINTLFDLLNYHFNHTEYDLIIFVTNNNKRIKLLSKQIYGISLLNNYKYLYVNLNKRGELIKSKEAIIYSDSNYIEDIENKILETKKDIGFIIIDNFDLLEIKNQNNYKAYDLSLKLKKLSIKTKLPILVFKGINNNKTNIANLLEPLVQYSDLIIYEDNDNNLNVIKNRYGELFELIDY